MSNKLPLLKGQSRMIGKRKEFVDGRYEHFNKKLKEYEELSPDERERQVLMAKKAIHSHRFK